MSSPLDRSPDDFAARLRDQLVKRGLPVADLPQEPDDARYLELEGDRSHRAVLVLLDDQRLGLVVVHEDVVAQGARVHPLHDLHALAREGLELLHPSRVESEAGDAQ